MNKGQKRSNKVIILFLLQGLLTFICFFILLLNSKYTGGQIGMAPLVLMKILFFQIIIILVVYTMLYRYIKSAYVYLIMNMFFFLIMLYKDFSKSYIYVCEDNLDGFFIRSTLLSIILSTILVSIICKKNG